MLFTNLLRIRGYEKEAIPWIKSMQDRDIVLAIGAAQEQGNYLGFKELALLNPGTPATVRRRLSRLLELGYIQKRVMDGDGRRTAYMICPHWMERFEKLEAGLKLVAYEIIMKNDGMKKADSSIIHQARNCEEVVGILRARLAPYGTIGRFHISCSGGTPTPLLTMVELDGNASGAAASLGGFVVGRDLLCASWQAGACFHCEGAPANATCMGVGDVA